MKDLSLQTSLKENMSKEEIKELVRQSIYENLEKLEPDKEIINRVIESDFCKDLIEKSVDIHMQNIEKYKSSLAEIKTIIKDIMRDK